MQKRNLPIPIYGGRLGIILSKDPVKLEEHYICDPYEVGYATTSKVACKETEGRLVAITLVYGDPDYPLTTAGIAHEAFHAAHMVLDHAGLELTDESQEAYAYLLSWIVTTVMREITKRKLKLNDTYEEM